MEQMSRPPKTNVRFLAARLGLGWLARIAPTAAERVTSRLFWRPIRPTRSRPPEAPGVPSHRFTVSSGASDVATWDWAGDGPTVLLVHGWGGQAAQMAAFVAPLVGAGFHVVAFDQPGHGQSTGGLCTALGIECALTAVARRVGPVHAIIAHSLGGTAAVMALARGGERASTVAPTDSRAQPAPGLGAVERLVLIAPPADAASVPRAFARVMGLPPASAEAVGLRVGPTFGASVAPDIRVLAPTMHTPLLVVHDAGDAHAPFAQGEAIAEAWPGARLLRTEGLGHLALLHDPTVIRAVVSFVAPPGARAHPAGQTRPLRAVSMR